MNISFKEWMQQNEGWFSNLFKRGEEENENGPPKDEYEAEDDRLGYVRGTTRKRRAAAEDDDNHDARIEKELGLEPGELARRRRIKLGSLPGEVDVTKELGISDEEAEQRRHWQLNQLPRPMMGPDGLQGRRSAK